jgi:hypothetical protein
VRTVHCEAATSLGLSTVLAAVVHHSSVLHPASTVPGDIGDPLLQAWELAWGAHAVSGGHNPFHTNTFFPATDSLAFSDPLLGYLPAGLFGSGPADALVRYNLLFVLVAALAAWGPYLLARQLGARIPGATVAALVCGYAPWRLSQLGHLNILSTGGIALALALLARGHGFPGRPSQPRMALLGWLVAAWQITIGFGLGLAFAMVLALVSVGGALQWLRQGRPTPARGLVLADAVGVMVLTATVTILSRPYLAAVRAHPEGRRTVADVQIYSPPLRGLLLAPQNSWLFGDLQRDARRGLGWPPEMCLLPGFTAILLAVVGLLVSGGLSVIRRLVYAGSIVVLAVFSLGTNGPRGGAWGFLLLPRHVPGWEGVRTPSRLVVLLLIPLALLAATGADRLVRGRPWLGVPLAGLVLLEGLGTIAHPVPPGRPGGLDRLGRGPALVLPSDEIGDLSVMWWTTKGFPTVVNGGSGFLPRATDALRKATADFPSASAVAALRRAGVRTVAVVTDRLTTEQAQGMSTGTLPAGVTRNEAPGVVLFDLGAR